MEREYPMEGGGGGDRGDDLDNDGPEPLATVGQLSSPRFASFFEPPLYIHTETDSHKKERGKKILLHEAFRTAMHIRFFHPLCIYIYL